MEEPQAGSKQQVIVWANDVFFGTRPQEGKTIFLSFFCHFFNTRRYRPIKVVENTHAFSTEFPFDIFQQKVLTHFVPLFSADNSSGTKSVSIFYQRYDSITCGLMVGRKYSRILYPHFRLKYSGTKSVSILYRR